MGGDLGAMMECYCEPAEGEPCEVWLPSFRTARKIHECCECHEEIKPGERYEYIFSIFEGEVTCYKTCIFCAGEWERIYNDCDFECMVKGELACALVWEIRQKEEAEAFRQRNIK